MAKITCPKCGNECPDDQWSCGACGEALPILAGTAAPSAKPNGVSCQQCGTGMKKTTKGESNMALQVFAVFAFFGSFFLLALFPIGTIAGVIIMIVSMRLGYSRRRVWLCPNCGYFFERAK